MSRAVRSVPRLTRMQGRLREWGITTALLCGAVWGVNVSRADVASRYAKLASGSDIYAIPKPDHLVVFSLGYRAAAADLLFGRTMVAAGEHFQEKRQFHHLDAYLKGIIALDPGYRDVYLYADYLLNLSTVEMPKENLRIARSIQEQGLQRFPQDAELWMTTGQFIAYLAPPRLPKSEVKAEWKMAGARIIQHACDIWPVHEELPDSCLNPASLLSRAGELAAAIQSLERMIAVSDDAHLRSRAIEKLRSLASEREVRKAQEARRMLDKLRVLDLPTTSGLRYQLVGPSWDPWNCIGNTEPTASLSCASSFATRSELIKKERSAD